MKKTSVLELVYSHHISKDLLIMHPNIGFELGLLTKTHAVLWCTGVDTQEFLQGKSAPGEPIQVDLRNECPPSQLQMNERYSRILGDKTKAVIFFDGQQVFIHTV